MPALSNAEHGQTYHEPLSLNSHCSTLIAILQTTVSVKKNDMFCTVPRPTDERRPGILNTKSVVGSQCRSLFKYFLQALSLPACVLCMRKTLNKLECRSIPAQAPPFLGLCFAATYRYGTWVIKAWKPDFRWTVLQNFYFLAVLLHLGFTLFI